MIEPFHYRIRAIPFIGTIPDESETLKGETKKRRRFEAFPRNITSISFSWIDDNGQLSEFPADALPSERHIPVEGHAVFLVDEYSVAAFVLAGQWAVT
jgi:hypothetical protein